MMKFTNFCGIFATVFVTTTMVILASCSQDDETYDSDMYTLAEEMGTRSGGDGGDIGATQTLSYNSNTSSYVDVPVRKNECALWALITGTITESPYVNKQQLKEFGIMKE